MLKIFFVLVCVERDVEQRAQGNVELLFICALCVRYLCDIGALFYAFIGSSCKLVCVKKLNIYQSL